MKFFLNALLAVFPGMFFNVNIQGQNTSTDKNDCFLNKIEKVYVQLEKHIFISGEALKYKVYIVNASSLKKSLQSKVVYFEISGQNGPVFSWRSNVNKGLCNGTVFLPDTISGGVYFLRAYTNWMRNIAPVFHFSTRIIITKINESDINQLPVPNLIYTSKYDPQPRANNSTSGYRLDIENTNPDKLIVNITRSGKKDNLSDNKLYRLVIYSRGQIIKDIPVTLSDSLIKVPVLKNELATGILDIILKNPYKKPVCEKLAYSSPGNPVSVNLGPLNKTYGKKEKVVLELELDGLDYTDTSWLSVAVSEKLPVQSLTNYSGISSYLYFYSEIAGYTRTANLPASITDKSAGYICNHMNPENYSWRIIPYDQMKFCAYIMENKGFVLTGRIQDKENNFQFKNQTIVLSCEDSIASMKYCYTDSTGMFYFLIDQLYDNRNLILQLINNNENKDLIWEIDRKSSPFPEFSYNTKILSPELVKYLQHFKDITLVNNIYKEHINENDLIDKIVNKPGRRIFCGEPDYVVYPSDFLELYDFTEIA